MMVRILSWAGRSENRSKWHVPGGRLRPLAAAVAVVAGYFAATPLRGQVEARYAPWEVYRPGSETNYNLRLGPVYYDVRAYLQVEFHSNIGYAETEEVSDFIVTPGINLGAIWELTPDQTLSMDLEIGYTRYLENGDLNSLATNVGLTPRSLISFLMRIGNLDLVIFDQPRVSLDGSNAVALDADTGETVSTVAQYRRIHNQLGVQGFYSLNVVDLNFQLVRADEIALDEEFEFRDHNEYVASVSAARDFLANLSGGLGLSYSSRRYEGGTLNDGTSWSLGPFINWSVTDFTDVHVGVSAVRSDFEEGGTVQDSTDFEGFSGIIRVSNELNEFFTHSLALERNVDFGFAANSSQRDVISYEGRWKAREDLTLNGGMSWEWGEDSGGLNRDEYSRWSSWLGTRFALSRKLTLSVNGELSHKDSEVELRSHDVLRAWIRLVYDF